MCCINVLLRNILDQATQLAYITNVYVNPLTYFHFFNIQNCETDYCRAACTVNVSVIDDGIILSLFWMKNTNFWDEKENQCHFFSWLNSHNLLINITPFALITGWMSNLLIFFQLWQMMGAKIFLLFLKHKPSNMQKVHI